MTDISIPQGDNPDVFSLGFDRSLNRDQASIPSSLLYNQFDSTQPETIAPGGYVMGSNNTMFAVDPTKGIWLGNAKFENAPFAVSMQGNLRALSGVFTGDITGASGTFSGTVVVGSIDIPNQSQANSFHVAGGATYGGDTWWGANTVNGTASANAYILNTGAATFKNIQMGGSTIQYVITNSGIFSFGDGSDGDATITSNATLTSDKYYNNLTVNNGATINPGGYRVFVKGVLTLGGASAGTIDRSGNNGTNGSAGIDGSGGGPGGAALADGYLRGSAIGGTGGNAGGGPGANGTSTANSLGSSAANAGAGGAGSSQTGGAGGTGGTSTTSNVKLIANWHLATLLDVGSSGSTIKFDNSASPGGGGSGGKGTGNGTGGGGGGSGGGIVAIYARSIIISANGSITANGGTGGNGGVAGSTNGGGGGGGGGGNGGVIILVYNTLTNSGTLTASAANGGTGGAKNGTGVNGTNGTNGTVGTIYQFQLSL